MVFGLGVLCVFFFFKQKTAYEVRISDWSSDVCSSDLLTATGGQGVGRDAQVRQDRGDLLVACHEDVGHLLQVGDDRGEVVARVLALQGLEERIGRASCRERECQYV